MRVGKRSIVLGAWLLLAGASGIAADDVYDYGEYLSAECVACHRLDGKDVGIPAIVAWAEADFVAVMKSYKRGERENPIMINVARSLGDEEMAALARFFNQQGEKGTTQ